MNPLRRLAERWRSEAETFRSYGAEKLALACVKHADELEAASAAQRLESVTLDEASKIGGYSYSHLQHVVRDGIIENVGEKGCPRIRRCDVPIKPGHRRSPEPRTKGELFKEEVLALRNGDA